MTSADTRGHLGTKTEIHGSVLLATHTIGMNRPGRTKRCLSERCVYHQPLKFSQDTKNGNKLIWQEKHFHYAGVAARAVMAAVAILGTRSCWLAVLPAERLVSFPPLEPIFWQSPMIVRFVPYCQLLDLQR